MRRASSKELAQLGPTAGTLLAVTGPTSLSRIGGSGIGVTGFIGRLTAGIQRYAAREGCPA